MEIEKQRLDIERESLEFYKSVGSQLLNVLPVAQKVSSSDEDKSAKPDSTPDKPSRKRSAESELPVYTKNDIFWILSTYSD